MNAVPLIATVGVVGAGAAYYYYQMYCPDANMSRDDAGDCICAEGYYLDPEDDQKCVSLSVTEATECKGVLVNGVYVYDADGDDLTDILADETEDAQIDCLLCNACEGSSKQAQDGRCLRCQPAATQAEWRESDALSHGESYSEVPTTAPSDDPSGWIPNYELAQAAKATPANPLSADYEWTLVTETSANDAEEVGPQYTPFQYAPTTGFTTTDPSSCPSQQW
jgi:hypothetical protein